MLGLATIDTDFNTWRKQNERRAFSTLYPAGRAPLSALLSLLDPEETDGPKFSWLEDRLVIKAVSTKINGLGGGPFASIVPATANPHVVALGTNFRVYIDNSSGQASRFNAGETITIQGVKDSAGVFTNLPAEVVSVDAGGNFMTLKPLVAISLANAVADNLNIAVLPLGNVVAEGSSYGTQQTSVRYPISVENYAQTQRDFMFFTANSLLQPMKFESSGVYRTKVKQTWQLHADALENSLLFGQRNVIAENLVDGTASERRFMGGIEWFLLQYQLANGGVNNYRPGGAAIAPAAGTFDVANQRIFRAQASGVVPKASWEDVILPALFANTTNGGYYKLLIGGQKALAAISTYYAGKTVINRTLQDKYKMDIQVLEVETIYGTIGLLTHPKFNAVPNLRGSFMALEFNNLRWRPVTGRDTKIRINQHDRGYDGRKDDFLTEGGLELQYPETHSMAHNFLSIA